MSAERGSFLCGRCGLTHPNSQRGKRHTKADLVRLAQHHERVAANIYDGLLATERGG